MITRRRIIKTILILLILAGGFYLAHILVPIDAPINTESMETTSLYSN